MRFGRPIRIIPPTRFSSQQRIKRRDEPGSSSHFFPKAQNAPNSFNDSLLRRRVGETNPTWSLECGSRDDGNTVLLEQFRRE